MVVELDTVSPQSVLDAFSVQDPGILYLKVSTHCAGQEQAKLDQGPYTPMP